MERIYRPFIYDRDSGDLIGDYARLENLLDPEDLKVSFGDDGIGAYEFWGFPGYDSRPYATVEEESDVGEWVSLIVGGDGEMLDEVSLKKDATIILDGMETSYTRDIGDERHDEDISAKLEIQDVQVDVPNQTVRFFIGWRDA